MTMRKFRVKASLKNLSGHHLRKTVTHTAEMGLEREFETFANGDDDAKVRP